MNQNSAKIINISIGGKYVPVLASTTKKKSDKVIKLGNHHFSVHTNQIYRTVCHVPPGMIRIIHLFSFYIRTRNENGLFLWKKYKIGWGGAMI